MQDRKQLRKQYRAARRNLNDSEQQQAAKALLAPCIELGLVNAKQKIAVYLQNDAEINPQHLIQYAWQNDVEVYLPAMHTFCSGYLVFVRFTEQTILKANRFGIPEPVVTTKAICPLAELNTIFTPLVAFDFQGNRLGMGGGFYDRTLAAIHRDKLPVQIIALAHDCQQAEKIPVQQWDMPVSKIVTPSKIISASS